ncbi:hypothetical protein E4T38_01848 [Aureobasidium subglaciale]|nr:hypothetical protein E4T38_01848 [Aureobasidium subglaciale]KAI5229232.1 hypothetical protein E4T40_01631 [Aureobasidium subglaciale]KAI5232977.1 hypothetical protein E4T41_01846 [Aureobasidium subglaciale]KAI5266369.1 hypothetical protein E4T46_01628 [Aureobasidium subglaciale]
MPMILDREAGAARITGTATAAVVIDPQVTKTQDGSDTSATSWGGSSNNESVQQSCPAGSSDDKSKCSTIESVDPQRINLSLSAISPCESHPSPITISKTPAFLPPHRRYYAPVKALETGTRTSHTPEFVPPHRRGLTRIRTPKTGSEGGTR